MTPVTPQEQRGGEGRTEDQIAASARAAGGTAEALRETLRANMFDGDEVGTVTMPIATLLTDVVEIVTEHWRLRAVVVNRRNRPLCWCEHRYYMHRRTKDHNHGGRCIECPCREYEPLAAALRSRA